MTRFDFEPYPEDATRWQDFRWRLGTWRQRFGARVLWPLQVWIAPRVARRLREEQQQHQRHIAELLDCREALQSATDLYHHQLAVSNKLLKQLNERPPPEVWIKAHPESLATQMVRKPPKRAAKRARKPK